MIEERTLKLYLNEPKNKVKSKDGGMSWFHEP